MLRTRVIPTLLVSDGDLIKGERFKNHKYVGDPVNAVRIFNEKEVDELSLLDIAVTNASKEPDYGLIREITSEAFMPMSYGGGVRSTKIAEQLFRSGVEKVIINSAFFETPEFVTELKSIAGSQSVVVSIDVRKSLFGKYEVYSHSGTKKTGRGPLEMAQFAEQKGAGEILLTSIDREGNRNGYDIDLIQKVTNSVAIPVIANGGVGCIEDLRDGAVKGGASGVAAGTFFTFHGKHKAVLLTYPSYQELEALLDY